MNKKILLPILAAEAAVSALLALTTGISGAMIGFPLVQLGGILRKMSLSGASGNTAAVIIYVIISLLPCVYLAVRAVRRRTSMVDIMLPILSALLFGGIYAAVNPTNPMAAMLYGSVLYSLLFGYIILRILHAAKNSESGRTVKLLRIMLTAAAIVFVFCAFGICIAEIRSTILNVNAANQGSETELMLTYIFIVLRYAVVIAAYIFDTGIAMSGLSLITALETDKFSEETAAAAEKTARRAVVALSVTVCGSMAVNILQLLCAPLLRDINTNANLPVTETAFALAALLLANYVKSAVQLRRDNDMFI